MANEGKISISTEMDLSGILNGADKINEILDEWKVNAETVSGSFRQLANSGGDFETLAGSIAGVVSTIKLAAEAQKTWETAMAVFQSSTGFGLAVTAIGAAVGVLNVMMKKAKEPSENLAKSLGIMGEKAESFVSGMSTAGNYLDNFNNTLFASSAKQQELNVQNGFAPGWMNNYRIGSLVECVA